ncbi:MAG: hypothetical protein JNL11_10770 [Bdellovibrionaceae bacterium]|nr:hypothetical protein [Pseudobdellovibrionaceae bacterium]
MRISWNKQNLKMLSNLIDKGLTNVEIAEKLGSSREAITLIANRYLKGNQNYQKRITKHAHLREPVMKYFLKHTASECQKKFKLTNSEFKSLMTVGYRDPKFKHLRKETRRHDAWSAKEYKFLLQHSGLRSRKWIAEKLNRGGELGIKDRLDLHGISSKNLNGLTLSQFRDAFGKDPEWFIQTSAGPGGNLHGGLTGYFKIVPWVYLKREFELKRLSSHTIIVQLVEAMAMFQDWFYEGNALKKLKKRRFI